MLLYILYLRTKARNSLIQPLERCLKVPWYFLKATVIIHIISQSSRYDTHSSSVGFPVLSPTMVSIETEETITDVTSNYSLEWKVKVK
jgi:hypothetical protein